MNWIFATRGTQTVPSYPSARREISDTVACPKIDRPTDRHDLGVDFLLGAPKSRLQAIEKLVVLAIRKVRLSSVRLAYVCLACFDFVPKAFDFEFSHRVA